MAFFANQANTPPPETALDKVLVSCRGAVMTAFLFTAGINLLMLTTPIFMMQTFDRVLNSRSMLTLSVLLIIALFCLVTQELLDCVRAYLLVRVGAWISRRISGELLDGAVMVALDRNGTRSVQGLRDLDMVRNFITGAGIFTIFDAVWVPIFMLVLFMLNFWFGMVAVFGAISLFGLAVLTEVTTKPKLERADMANMRAMTRADQAVRNAEVVEALGMRPGILKRWRVDHQESVDLQSRTSEHVAVLSALSKFTRMAVQILQMAVAVLELIQPNSSLTGGALFASYIIIGRTLMPIDMIVGQWKFMAQAWMAYRRIQYQLRSTKARPRASTLPTVTGHLQVEHASFVPPGVERPVLNRVSFELKPGEALGIIGPSAAGKSTLARFIVGIGRLTSGTIRLDGADVYTWPSEDLGRYVGYVPQDVELFTGTLRDNIARFGDATDEEVIRAAELAGMHEMILRFPKGYETEIGERGLILSGGQRQRIALARALLGGPKLLVLDEPNASLDSAGEQALLEAIGRAKEAGTTVIVIAHKPQVMRVVDKIMVMQEGRVQRIAPRDDIIAGFNKAVAGSTVQPLQPPTQSVPSRAG